MLLLPHNGNGAYCTADSRYSDLFKGQKKGLSALGPGQKLASTKRPKNKICAQFDLFFPGIGKRALNFRQATLKAHLGKPSLRGEEGLQIARFTFSQRRFVFCFFFTFFFYRAQAEKSEKKKKVKKKKKKKKDKSWKKTTATRHLGKEKNPKPS